MTFLLDENADFRLAAYLRSRGHDVTAIAYDYPYRLPDREVLSIAHSEGRILITNDRDFGELIIHQQLPHAGVIYFRLRSVDLPTLIARLEAVLRDYADDLSQQRCLVVTNQRIRVRPQPR